MLFLFAQLTGTACGAGAKTQLPHPPCAKGEAAPITLAHMRQALAKAGYRTTIDTIVCTNKGSNANQGNLTFGNTSCTVYMEEWSRARRYPHAFAQGPNFSGNAYAVAYENIDCWAHGATPNANVVQSLRKIFNGLGATGLPYKYL